MTLLSLGAAAAGALLSLVLLIRRVGGRDHVYARGAIHLIILAAFAVASGAHAREGMVWSAFGILAAGAVWSGVFWVLSIRGPASRTRGGKVGGEPQRGGESGIAPEARDALEPTGRALLTRLLDLDRVQVREMTVPRERIVYADLSGGVGEVLAKIRATGHLRIPMADRSLDRIVGIAYAKDLVPHVMEGGPTPPLKGVIRRPLFVSQDRPMSRLLDLFRTHRGHLAIVVDEYSRTVGLVTRDDVFRALAGNGEGST
jgi:CBS domain-containing protein